MAEERIFQYGEGPGFEIRAGHELVPVCKSLRDGLLDQVIGIVGVLREFQGKGIEGGKKVNQFGFHLTGSVIVSAEEWSGDQSVPDAWKRVYYRTMMGRETVRFSGDRVSKEVAPRIRYQDYVSAGLSPRPQGPAT